MCARAHVCLCACACRAAAQQHTIPTQHTHVRHMATVLEMTVRTRADMQQAARPQAAESAPIVSHPSCYHLTTKKRNGGGGGGGSGAAAAGRVAVPYWPRTVVALRTHTKSIDTPSRVRRTACGCGCGCGCLPAERVVRPVWRAHLVVGRVLRPADLPPSAAVLQRSAARCNAAQHVATLHPTVPNGNNKHSLHRATMRCNMARA